MFLRQLHSWREKRVSSLLALSNANVNETYARAQSLHHAGAEEVLGEVLTFVGTLAHGDTDA